MDVDLGSEDLVLLVDVTQFNLDLIAKFLNCLLAVFQIFSNFSVELFISLVQLSATLSQGLSFGDVIIDLELEDALVRHREEGVS